MAWPHPAQTSPDAERSRILPCLQGALPGDHVYPQVSLAALLTDDGQLSARERRPVRARFDRKIADFVVCERGILNVVALVELDDRTHVAAADRQRDAITKAAGYRAYRFPSRQKPTAAEIAALFPHAARPGSTTSSKR